MPALRLLFRSRPGTPLDVAALCASVQSVFDGNGVDVRVDAGASDSLDLPGMNAVAVGSCIEVVGTDHLALFESVAPPPASRGEAVVFVVGSITDGGVASGCAAHTAGCPGVLITEAAADAAANGGTAAGGRWVLAHEIGHLLRLQHVGASGSLMCDPPTAITADMPQLSDPEKETVLGSPLLAPAAFAGLAPTAQAMTPSIKKKKERAAARRKKIQAVGRKKGKAASVKKRRTTRKTTRRGPRKKGRR